MTTATHDLVSSDEVAARARRRIVRRILPFIILLYIIAYLDRVNISYAALEMRQALGFSDAVYGFGAGIFFIGYVVLEIPGTLLVENWSARLWISRIMISWGLLAVLTGFIHSATQFYWIRFLLGAAEAGFFPGLIVYLSHWFRYEDRAKAVAMLMAAIPIANIIGAPVSGLLLGINWFGIPGWRWIFILEGLPAIIFGIIVIFYLTDWPHQAKWLQPEECEWIKKELERERDAKKHLHSHRIRDALRRKEVILLTLAYFFSVTGAYGFNLWLPTIVKSLSGLPNLIVTLIAALPYCAALISMLVVGWSSDRMKERRWHTALSLMAVSLGLLLSVLLQNNIALTIAMFCLAGAGLYGYLPGFWALPTSFLSGSAAAASIGLINMVGNIGGFAGPYIVGRISTATHSFWGGIIYLSISALISSCLILSLRPHKQKAEHAAKV